MSVTADTEIRADQDVSVVLDRPKSLFDSELGEPIVLSIADLTEPGTGTSPTETAD